MLMNTTRLTLLIALTFSLACPPRTGAQAAAPPEDPAHQELRALRDGLLAAINRGDLTGVEPFLHTNCVVTWHNAEVSRGHAGVRAYFDRVMKGPNKLVDSFKCDITVDELTILYGGDTGVCWGGTDERFVLTGGKPLNIKGRWSATLVKENGRWLIASLHASTNLFDNVLLNLAERAAVLAGVACLATGLILGWLVGRRRKAGV